MTARVNMTSVYDSLRRQIQHNRSAEIVGLPTRLTRLDEFTTGVQQGMYILVGAETGVGKTKLVRDQYVYYLYNQWLKHRAKFEVDFLDFSLEMTAQDNLADLVSKDIYVDHKKIVTRNMLLSRARDKDGLRRVLDDENMKLFDQYEPKYTEFEKHLHIIDYDVTAIRFHDYLFEHARQHGTFQHSDARWIYKAGAYTPNNPDKYTLITFDTINLADGDETTKAIIDKISRLMVWFCNVCRFTGIILQQFNAEISGTERAKMNIRTPMLRDFEDSKRTTKDAHIVLGLFDPVRQQMDRNLGYDIAPFEGQFRSIYLMKNRFGDNNKAIGLLFKGAVGLFAELPPPEQLANKPDLIKKLITY